MSKKIIEEFINQQGWKLHDGIGGCLHNEGLPADRLAMIKPERLYGEQDSDAAVVVTADWVAVYTIPCPYNYSKWRPNTNRKPYRSKAEFVEVVNSFVRRRPTIWDGPKDIGGDTEPKRESGITKLQMILGDADYLMDKALAGADLDAPADQCEAGVNELRAFRKLVPLIEQMYILLDHLGDDQYSLTPDQWSTEAHEILGKIEEVKV